MSRAVKFLILALAAPLLALVSPPARGEPSQETADLTAPAPLHISVLKPVRAGEPIERANLDMPDDMTPEAHDMAEAMVGKAARRALYPGRAITMLDTAPMDVIDRNDVVKIQFTKGLLELFAEGRALGSGAVGDTIRVMNIDSKTIVSGKILEEGKVQVR